MSPNSEKHDDNWGEPSHNSNAGKEFNIQNARKNQDEIKEETQVSLSNLCYSPREARQ